MLVESGRYSAQIDMHEKSEWHEIIQRFNDNNIYQTWSHAGICWGEDKLSHLVLKCDDEIVAAAQVVIVKAPWINAGIGHVKFGPLWLTRGKDADPKHYAAMLRALHDEYVTRRGLTLRLKPWEVGSEPLQQIRNQQGFQQPKSTKAYDTFVMDLSCSEEEHWKSLKPRWRQELNKCRRNHNLVFEEIAGTTSIDIFIALYVEMSERKRFADFTDFQDLHRYYADLPTSLRPYILTCQRDGEVLAAIICSVLGHYALALFGATSVDGRDCGASYFLNWNVVNWLRQRENSSWYDLVGGTRDPGVRHFKQGLLGKCGVRCDMWDYDLTESRSSELIVNIADRSRVAYRKFRREHWS